MRDNHDVAEAAADGWLWGLTPFDDVVLVHAVPRPLEAPRPTILVPLRGRGDTEAVAGGRRRRARPAAPTAWWPRRRWVDPVDDLLEVRWQERAMSAVAFQTAIA